MKKIICVYLAALILLSVTACGKKEEPEMVYVDEGPIAVTEQPLRDFVLYFTQGCAAEDMLYYARVSKLAQDGEIGYLRGNVGLVDLGGFLREDETQGYDAVDAMNRLGYDAAAVAQNDMQLGITRVLNASNSSDFPFLCCDLVQSETGDAMLDSWTMAWHGGRCIAYIGFCASAEGGSFTLSDGERNYECAADTVAIQAAIDSARSAGAELVILLLSGGDAGLITAELTGVDVTVCDRQPESQTTAGSILYVEDGRIGKLIVCADGSMETSCESLTTETDSNMADYLASLGYEIVQSEEETE